MRYAQSYQDCSPPDDIQTPEPVQAAVAHHWVANPHLAVGPRWHGEANINFVERCLSDSSDDLAPLLAALVGARVRGDMNETMRLAGQLVAKVEQDLYDHYTDDACTASQSWRQVGFAMVAERERAEMAARRVAA